MISNPRVPAPHWQLETIPKFRGSAGAGNRNFVRCHTGELRGRGGVQEGWGCPERSVKDD